MKLLHVIPVLWSGAGEVVTHLCERQAGRHQVTLATSAYKGSLRDWPAYRRRLRDAGVRVVTIDTFSRDPQVFWSSVDRLGRLARDWRPDVVHTHAGVPACVFACTGVAPRMRHVAQMYSWGEGRPLWMNRMDVWGFRQADRVVCSARRYETMLRSAGVARRKLAYVRLGVSLEGIDAALKQRRRVRRDVRIGYVGRVERRKGQLELIRAFGLVRRSMPNVRLDLVGPVADPAYAARCRVEARRCGVTAHVNWRGYVRDVPPIVAGWRLFVSLSIDEGQGLAVQEAMAAGVPIVALKAPGIEDCVTDGRTGVLVADRKARRVSGAVVEALQHPASLSRLAAAGSRLIRREYSWERCESAFDRLYRTATT
jgi:glycosyltransferase involved in cell wall biosynthesis